MILTITPNPALDLSGEVDDIVPNEKNYVESERRFPGGNGINAARVLAALNVPVAASGFLGGAVGSEVEALLKAEAVDCRFIKIRNSTRINITVSNRSTCKQTRFSFSGSAVDRQDIDHLLDLVSQDPSISLLNIGGSFPPGFELDDVQRIFEIAHARGIGVVADVPSKHLEAVLRMRPLLIKPNLKEFSELIGTKLETKSDVCAAAARINEHVPLVCVSSVEGGVVMVTSIGSIFAKGPRVDAKSSVGAGDSMVGGIMAALFRSQVTSLESARSMTPDVLVESLRWGLAAALATVVTPGTELGKADGIAKFLPDIQVQQLN